MNNTKYAGPKQVNDGYTVTTMVGTAPICMVPLQKRIYTCCGLPRAAFHEKAASSPTFAF